MLCKRPDVFLFWFESAWEGRMMLHGINTLQTIQLFSRMFHEFVLRLRSALVSQGNFRRSVVSVITAD
jgi:hypothetical protein